MTEYLPSTYGDRIADQYDTIHLPIEQAAIDLLAELASGGPVLELGIGTGRIALPLASRGLKVQGVDASEAMVARLRAKPGGKDIPVTIADFREFDLGEKFALIFVAFNTFFTLPGGFTAGPPVVRRGAAVPGQAALRLALGARSHGPPRQPDTRQPLGELAARGVWRSERFPRVRVSPGRVSQSLPGEPARAYAAPGAL